MGSTHLRLGVVQIDCKVGQVQANLEHACDLVEQAARQGAELVLLPELTPSGYLLTEDIWDYAEPCDGPTAVWLTHIAKSLGIYLGTTFLEAEGEDFYNTFLLATPQGEIAGRVRKSPPASLEAYFYRAGTGSHVIETGLGRIGVGICYENLLYERLINLSQAAVDLVLQPAAAGRPIPMKPGDIQAFDRLVERIPQRFTHVLGIPTLLANRVGQIDTPMPGDLGFFHSSFPGRSAIVNGDGSTKARLGEEEGVLVAEVLTGVTRSNIKKPRRYGKMWALPTPWYAFIWPQTQQQGEQAYAVNIRRKERALAISRNT